MCILLMESILNLVTKNVHRKFNLNKNMRAGEMHL